jgi:hypothetical protein
MDSDKPITNSYGELLLHLAGISFKIKAVESVATGFVHTNTPTPLSRLTLVAVTLIIIEVIVGGPA